MTQEGALVFFLVTVLLAVAIIFNCINAMKLDSMIETNQDAIIAIHSYIIGE